MACPSVATGAGFLSGVLDHVDCQAQALGSYGFQALARPGGSGAALLASALALLVALLGFKMILGRRVDGADIVGLTLRAAMVVTLAVSWPAFRTLAYDTVLKGPAQLVTTIADPGNLPAASGGLSARLQDMDSAILALTVRGTGRATGVPGYAPTQDFRGAVLDDNSTMGWARVTWLAGTLAPLVALRLVAGLLLALTPLFALALLFDATRGLFAGWVRGLVLCLIGSAGLAVIHATQLAILEPWAAGALQMRGANYATPSVPTELLALNLAFAIAANLALALLARVAFQRGWVSLPEIGYRETTSHHSREAAQGATFRSSREISRAEQMVMGLARLDQRRDSSRTERMPQGSLRGASGGTPDTAPSQSLAAAPAGAAYRRSARRASSAGQRRDRTT